MSQSQNQRSTQGPGPNTNEPLPPINQRRLADVIDYAQPGHQAGLNDAEDYDNQEGYPIQLVTANPKTGKFALNEQIATDLITNYDGKISFVTVAGKYKSGKSFLLNRLLNLRGEGFNVDHSDQAGTEGIWMWSKPVYSERDDLYIFLLDVEGSHSVNKTAAHDAKIFALALLMSSYIIYNSFGSIDENAINGLSLMTQLPKHIIVQEEDNSQQALSYFTPKFLWALRDFVLEVQDSQGKFISTNQYMENALSEKGSHAKTSETNKKIRQAIVNCFRERECMAFVRPIYDGREFGPLNQIQNAPIRPDFTKQINNLRDKIINWITPKQLKGVNLNMRMYMAMVSSYIDSFNQGLPLNISTAFDFLVENECREAYEQSVELYEIALKQFFFDEERAKTVEELYNILKNIRDSTLEKYHKMTVELEKFELSQHFKSELKDYIEKQEQQIISINEELNQINNIKLLEQLSQDMKENIGLGAYTAKNIDDFHNDFNKLLDDYEVEGQGISKTSGLIKFVNLFQPEIVSVLLSDFSETMRIQEQTLKANKAKLAEDEKTLKKVIDEAKLQEKEVVEELSKEKTARQEMIHKAQKIQDKIDKMKDQEEKKLEAERGSLKIYTKDVKKAEEEIKALEVKNKEYLQQIENRKNACCNVF